MRVTRTAISVFSSVTLLAFVGSPVLGQFDREEEGPPRLFQLDPVTPVELVRGAFTATRLNRAVIAREYGLPCVVNSRVGTRVINTGDRLKLDGDSGIVEILS